MRSNSLNPGFLLFSLDIPSISRAWVDEKKFCSGFPFFSVLPKICPDIGAHFRDLPNFAGRSGPSHKSRIKNCRQEPPPKPAACKKPAAQTDSRKWFCAVFDLPIYVMKSHMFCADFFDDPVVKSAEAVRIPRFACAWRWEQIRIRRVTFMFFYEKFHRIFRQ